MTDRRKESIRTLINLVILEGFLIAAVIVVYLYTGKLVHLIGGVIGASLIIAPLFIRWIREHGKTPAQDAGDTQSETDMDRHNA